MRPSGRRLAQQRVEEAVHAVLAREALAAGARVDIYDAMPSAGRKFLMAGKSGLNIDGREGLQKLIAEKLGYRLVDHRMELYGVRLGRPGDKSPG